MIAQARLALPEIVNPAKVQAAKKGLPARSAVEDAVEVFKILANPVRLSLMHALAHDELTVGDIARALALSLSVVSHQLAMLRRMRLVASRDEGRLTYYRATDEFVGHLVHDCLAHVGESLGGRAKAHHHKHKLPGPAPAGRTRRR